MPDGGVMNLRNMAGGNRIDGANDVNVAAICSGGYASAQAITSLLRDGERHCALQPVPSEFVVAQGGLAGALAPLL